MAYATDAAHALNLAKACEQLIQTVDILTGKADPTGLEKRLSQSCAEIARVVVEQYRFDQAMQEHHHEATISRIGEEPS